MSRLGARHPRERRRLGRHYVAAGGAHALDIASEARLEIGAHVERAHRARRGGYKLVHRLRAEDQVTRRCVARRSAGRRRDRRHPALRRCRAAATAAPRRRGRGSIVWPRRPRGAPALGAGAPRTARR